MAFRTPKQYLESLRDGRVVYVNGQRVDDLTSHPLTQDWAHKMAEDYEAFRNQETRDIFVAKDPETGEEVDRLMLLPRSPEDLLARARAIDHSIRYGGPHFGSDAMLSVLWVAPELEKANPVYRRNIEHFYRRFLHENLSCCIAMSDTKGDRSLDPSQQEDPDLYVHKVGERDGGIVIRGMKAHITWAPFVDELVVLPTKRMKEDEGEYSLACLVPPNAPGVKILMRMDEGHPSRLDYPLSFGGGGGESFIWFDDVFVPWERVFQNGESWLAGPIAYALGLWERYSSLCYKRATVEMLAGAASLAAKFNGIERAGHIQDKLFEFALLASSLDAFISAAALNCEYREGVAIPNQTITNVGKYMFASQLHNLVTHVLDIAGAIVVTAPTEETYRHPDLHDALSKYLSGGKRSTADDRLRLINFIRDLCADTYAGRTAVLTLHAEGSLAAQKMMTLRGYDFSKAEEYVRRIAGIGGAEQIQGPFL